MHAAATDYWKLALSLKDRNEVIFTPHNAFNTEESLDRKSKLACESIKQFLQEGHFPDEVPYKILWR
jgi:D-lactate dehydrogenase